jgi:hypothetical protein
MQAVGAITDTLPGTVYHKPNRTGYSRRREQGKKNYGAQRCCNSFLKAVFTPIAPQAVTRLWNEVEYNYITKDNYDYLLASALNYASLLGVELKHNPGKSPGEGISNIYDELDGIIGNINLNIETNGDKLQFVLWKYHPWEEYTFYWLPVKFAESLNPKLKKIALSFIHQFIHSNGMITTNESYDVEWVLEWAKEGLFECEACDRRSILNLLYSYEKGKVRRLMARINNKTYYKNLPAALDRYVPNNEFERALIGIFREGLQFTGIGKPSIMSYGYDPLLDEEQDYQPVDMERMIRVVYDTDDFVSDWLMEYANNELRESYDISPATWLPISPDTTELFSMDDYPDRFSKWFDKIRTLIA